MSMIFEMLSYPFVVRALVGGILVSLCCALLGVSLVLKRYSMIGDGLSHVSFGALSIAVAAGWSPLKVSIPLVVLAAFFFAPHYGARQSQERRGHCHDLRKLPGYWYYRHIPDHRYDHRCRSYMFGSILAMSREDVILSAVLSIIVLCLFVFCYNKLFAVTFDENFAKATGVNVELYNVLIAVLTAVTIVLGMRMMGAMLISSLIIFPALTSMRIFKSFRGVVICSGVLAVVCFLMGIIFSYGFSTPAGASVVLVNLAAFIVFSVVQSVMMRVTKK